MNLTRMLTGIPNSHILIDFFCGLIEDAFDGKSSHSLVSNLANIREENWDVIPSGGGRSIADILEHIGWCKWMYDDYAFGTASLRGDQPPQIPPHAKRSRPRDELMAWLKAGHDKWLASVRALDDDKELERDRLTNWGEWMKTRTIIKIMISHDYYHAGEINHLRSLLQGTDHWEY